MIRASFVIGYFVIRHFDSAQSVDRRPKLRVDPQRRLIGVARVSEITLLFVDDTLIEPRIDVFEIKLARRAKSLLGQIERLDQQLQDDSGGGFYIGDGSDGGYYPNG